MPHSTLPCHPAATHPQDEIIKSALAHRNIPPHHPEATTASEAYRFEELVPPSIRDALEITKLFPAENKPEYREQLRSSGMVRRGVGAYEVGWGGAAQAWQVADCSAGMFAAAVHSRQPTRAHAHCTVLIIFA
jgi:hypothetical protein